MQYKLAWLAGLWDGEGSITIFKTKIGNRYKYCPTLSIVNCDMNIMNEVEKMIIGLNTSMHWVTAEHDNPKHATSYSLITRNHTHIKTVLEAMLPYLVGKKAQAEIVLRFIDRRQSQLANKKTHIGPDDVLDDLCNEVQKLNRKGPKSPTTIRRGAIPHKI